MANTNAILKVHINALIDTLPEEALAEVMSFIEFQRFKLVPKESSTPPYLPTPMGGLWKGARITAEDITEARREMWGRFADDEP